MAVLNAAVIGQGFMGAIHARSYLSATAAGLPCRLVAVCDARAEALDGAGGIGNLAAHGAAALPADVRRVTDARAVFDDPSVHVVSVCTPTDTHVPLALAALAAGKHVLLEKPVAVEARDVRRLAEAARLCKARCMPAMCMRFWPGWAWLRERIDEGTFGVLHSLTLQRMGAAPSWSRAFYGDESRSGGAIVDLHIHDTDFVVHLFGKPSTVRTSGSPMHCTTLYSYEDERAPRHVTAEGAWTMRPNVPFAMRYRAAFERATVEFELSRTPSVVVYEDGRVWHPALPTELAYDAQLRHFVLSVARGAAFAATLDEAVVVAEVLEAERASMRTGGVVRVD